MKKQVSRVIHMVEATTRLQKKNRWSRTGKWLGSLLLLWLEMITSVRIFLEMFPTNRRVDWTMLLIGALVIALWMLLVYAKSRWMPVLFLVTLFGIGGFLWREWQWVWRGVSQLIDAVIRQINTYHHQSYSLWNLPVTNFTGILICCMCLLGIWCGYYTVRRRGATMACLPAFCIILLGFGTGRMPDWQSTMVLIGLFFALYSLQRRTLRKPSTDSTSGAVVMGVMAVLLFALCFFIAGPFLEGEAARYQMELREMQQKFLSSWEESRENSDEESRPSKNTTPEEAQPSSQLSNNAPFFTGRIVLTAALNQTPQGALYLREFAGRDYNGRSWTAVQSGDWQERELQVQTMIYERMIEEGEEPVEIIVRLMRGIKEYAYVPYYTMLPEELKAYADGMITVMTNPYTYWGFPFTELEGDIQDHPYEREYRRYVYEKYLELPEQGLERLLSECQADGMPYGPENLDNITEYIRGRLSALTYSQDLEPLPAGTDYTEYFLYEQQKGYCVHFATAATLMYRAMGIPARFVTGYMIPRSEFNDENAAYARDYMGHAWTEIYKDGWGWIYVDMTPPSADNPLYNGSTEELSRWESRPESREESRQESRREDSAEESIPMDTDSQGTLTGGEKPAAGGSRVWLWLGEALLGILCLAIFAAVIWGRREYLCEKREKRKEEDYRTAISDLGQCAFRAYTFSGHSMEEPLEADFGEEFCKEMALPEARVFWNRLREAAYGGRIMDETEYTEALREYHMLLQEMEKGWGTGKRLWARWGLCLY